MSIVVTGTPPNGSTNTLYIYAFNASGGVAPYTFSGSGLPPGLVLNSNGVLSGVPNQAGTFTFLVQATDSTANTGTNSFTVTISTGITVVGSPPSSSLGATYSTTFTAFGGLAPYTLSGVDLPPGLLINAAGVMSGTLSQNGTFTFTIQALDANSNTGAGIFTILVSSPVVPYTGSTASTASSGSAVAPLITVRQRTANGDVAYGNGTQNFLVNGAAVAQIINTTLLLLQGQWWMNTAIGTPLFQQLTSHPITPQAVALIYQQIILGVPFVSGIQQLAVNYNPQARTFSFTATVNTLFGAVPVSG
jgi:hypothetical protein